MGNDRWVKPSFAREPGRGRRCVSGVGGRHRHRRLQSLVCRHGRRFSAISCRSRRSRATGARCVPARLRARNLSREAVRPRSAAQRGAICRCLPTLKHQCLRAAATVSSSRRGARPRDMYMSVLSVSIAKQDSCARARMVALIEATSTSPKEQKS